MSVGSNSRGTQAMKLHSTTQCFFLALVASAMLLFHSGAIAIGPTYSGTWYNPQQDGHGFSLEYVIQADGTPLVVAYWYLYDSAGFPLFLVGVGEPRADNSVKLMFDAPWGMKFGEFDPSTLNHGDGGTGVFTFDNEDSGVFVYQPSDWIVGAWGLSPITTPMVKLIGVAPSTGTEPPPDDTYISTLDGSWTGRMIYDRRSVGTCYDADVRIKIATGIGLPLLNPITVIRDVGGLASFNDGFWVNNSGVTGEMQVFGVTIDITIQFPQIGTYGHAEGYWNYHNGACYGEWTFTKD